MHKDSSIEEVKCQKSKDFFDIKFGGENEIDAAVFSSVMNEIVEMCQVIAPALEPEAFVKINIKTTSAGSFVAMLDAIVVTLPNILTLENINIAKTLTSCLIDCFHLKKFLQGKKPKKVEPLDDAYEVTNQKNDKILLDQSSGNIILNNSKLENSTVNIFNILTKDNSRDGFEIKNQNKKVTLQKTEYLDMTKKVIEIEQPNQIPDSQTIPVSLLLKKPDLLGNSKWEFYLFNKMIETKIEDVDFIKKVKKGEVKLYAGVKLPCMLTIECKLNEDHEPIQGSEVFTITKVTGNVIEPLKSNDLFENDK